MSALGSEGLNTKMLSFNVDVFITEWCGLCPTGAGTSTGGSSVCLDLPMFGLTI